MGEMGERLLGYIIFTSMTEPKSTDSTPRIVIQKNGPYDVYGGIPLHIQNIVANTEGKSWDWENGETFKTEESYQLCRCGHSSNKPFCDDTHLKVGFNGTETASRLPYDQQAKKIDGPTVIMGDAGALCSNARFCSAFGRIRNLVAKSDDPDVRAEVIREVMHCPSGRLTLYDKTNNQEIENTLEPAIGIVEDIPLGCSGPLWVQGGIAIESADGEQYEIRNRVTLCRCGSSRNKPFCDGSHVMVGFSDVLFD
jgi:CDGSH-type Zn-finger protein